MIPTTARKAVTTTATVSSVLLSSFLPVIAVLCFYSSCYHVEAFAVHHDFNSIGYHHCRRQRIACRRFSKQESTPAAPRSTDEKESIRLVAPERPTSSLPRRKRQGTSSSNSSSRKKGKQSKKERNKKPSAESSWSSSSSSSRGRPLLSECDLAEHVSSMYIHGPGGLLRDKRFRRQQQQQHQEEEECDFVVFDNDRKQEEQQRRLLREELRQDEYLKRLNRHPALVLNADYQPLSFLPLSLWHWQDAIKATFTGKVTVVDVYPDVTVRAAKIGELPLPAVIALNEYVPKQYSNQKPAFTKRNVFLRDEYRCQYCNGMFHTKDLSLDHVVPRSMGGTLHWENAVTSCLACNGRKGSLPVRELRSVGMRLLRSPKVPTQYELAAVAGRMLPQRRVHPTWEPYLQIQCRSSSSSTRKTTNRDPSSIAGTTMTTQQNNEISCQR